MSEISPQIQELETPELNDTLKLGGLLKSFGKITAESRIAGIKENISRPLSLRNTRAKLFEKAMHSDKAERGAILREAHARDEIARQYLNQGDVSIELPGLGKQVAKYTIIEPPESLRGIDTESHPPIFIIPGISNDIDCIGGLVQELPMHNRKVVSVGFPDSFMGSVTEEFADAVIKSEDFSNHTKFYKEAIKSLIGDGDFELWGHSTGSAIAAELLNDPEFSTHVTNAVLVAPAGVVEQNKLQVATGLASEILELGKRFSNLGRYTKTSGRGEAAEPEGPGQRELKVKIFNSLIEKTSHKHEKYKTARVKDGGSVVIVSGQKDHVTKSADAIEGLHANSQIAILDLPDASHISPLIESEEVVPEIFELQKMAGK